MIWKIQGVKFLNTKCFARRSRSQSSADWQSAVSRIDNPLAPPNLSVRPTASSPRRSLRRSQGRRYSRLPTCATTRHRAQGNIRGVFQLSLNRSRPVHFACFVYFVVHRKYLKQAGICRRRTRWPAARTPDKSSGGPAIHQSSPGARQTRGRPRTRTSSRCRWKPGSRRTCPSRQS
jgi:hypothetical protein